MKISKVEVEVPAGKYILGDPCYAVPDSDWDALLKSCNFFESPIGYIKDGLQEFPVVAFSTRWGDGCYAGTDGNSYPVDAGLIGLVPVEVVGMESSQSEFGSVNTDCTVVTFTTAVKCSTDGQGKLRFGHITIDTDPVEEDDE
jgi:hypothetical protein